MTMYKREVKYKWLWWNGRGSYVLSDETEWMSEEEAKEKNIKISEATVAGCLPLDFHNYLYIKLQKYL